jgi:hypothetical protein
MNAPKKIWLYPEDAECYTDRLEKIICEYTKEQDAYSEVKYIRADLVDGLVIALRHWFASQSDWDQLEDEVKAALKALEEK